LQLSQGMLLEDNEGNTLLAAKVAFQGNLDMGAIVGGGRRKGGKFYGTGVGRNKRGLKLEITNGRGDKSAKGVEG